MMVFVSHSSADKVIAEAFVEFLRAALPLVSKDVRCTSVDGYKLPVEAKADEQLRVDNLAQQLKLTAEKPTVYLRALQKFIAAAKGPLAAHRRTGTIHQHLLSARSYYEEHGKNGR
jgi:hypothetical protein